MARVVGLDAFDVPEGRLPRTVRLADGVPHPAVIGEPDELQLTIDPGAADGGEVAWVVGLDGFDVPEGRLPRAVI